VRAVESPSMNVLVVVPGEVERAGMRLLVEDAGHCVVAEAADGSTALALAEKTEPDVALVDFTITDVPALALIHSITRKCPGTQTLLYTQECGRDWIELALREGVRAFVLKGQTSKHLAPALRALSDHRPYWEGAVKDELLDELLECGPRPALTSREWQILQMVEQELTSKEMARALGISPKTIECFRARLRRKLGLRSKADLFRYIWQQQHA
jgi:DNA-binding NarL/FixJ family response regulator